ncbi:MAG: hypothetical protein IPI49_08050 [Myxococcales bacterium]|nr:hypothetical protein [Myxococcales bacterium]
MERPLVKIWMVTGLFCSLTPSCGGSTGPAKQPSIAARADEVPAIATPKGEPANADAPDPEGAPAAEDAPAAPDAPDADPDDEESPRVRAARALLEQEDLGGLRLGMRDREVIAILGKPSSKGKAVVEGATGEVVATWEWKRAGVRVLFSDVKKRPTVRNLSLGSGARLKTKRGIGLGSTLAELDAAYGAGRRTSSDESDPSYLVGTLYDGMVFELADGKVVSLYWGVLAE